MLPMQLVVICQGSRIEQLRDEVHVHVGVVDPDRFVVDYVGVLQRLQEVDFALKLVHLEQVSTERDLIPGHLKALLPVECSIHHLARAPLQDLSVVHVSDGWIHLFDVLIDAIHLHLRMRDDGG